MALQLLQPFIVRPDPNAPHDHWQGGAPIHCGASCKQCGKPFQLIWNLNCSDPRFLTKTGHPIFRNLSRLPLYWCVPCFNSIHYLIVDDEAIEVLCVEGKPIDQVKRKRPDPPYKHFPQQFSEQPLRLSTVAELPRTVQKLLSKNPPQLTANRRTLLEKHVGHRIQPKIFSLMGTWVHLFGGNPYLPQGDQWIVCPNRRCRSHGKRMKSLAAIHNDPPNGLPFIETIKDVGKDGSFNFLELVYFHICSVCNTIHGHSQGT